jgi:hypothetical protein
MKPILYTAPMKSLFSLLILIVPLVSRAQSFSEFKGESRSIVQKLRSQGIKQVGNIDLDVLDKQISETKWGSVKDKFLVGSGEERSTSIYLVEQRAVIVNELALQTIDRSIYPQASLHEVLGANGYDDEKSKISLSLDQIAKDPSKKALFEKRLEKSINGLKTNKIYQNKSGGTSVGGGGDGTAIEFKKILLEIALENLSENSDQILDAVLDSDIEPNWNRDQFYDLKIQKFETSYRIDIPSILWVTLSANKLNGAERKADLVRAVYKQLF